MNREIMAKPDNTTDKGPANTVAGGVAQPRFSDKDIKAAQAWFKRAAAVADSRNYDYAIECYINGLKVWPEAVEEGHKRLYAVGMARRTAGMKKAGMIETLKHPAGVRDSVQGMLNAEFLMAKDPSNTAHMEAALKNADKAGLDETIRWLGPLFLDAIAREKKASASRLKAAQQVFLNAAARAEASGNFKGAIECYQCAITTIEYYTQLKPADLEAGNTLRDVSGRLAIVKGNYDKAGDFRDSLNDADKQRRIHDEDRLVQDQGRQDQLVEKIGRASCRERV